MSSFTTVYLSLVAAPLNIPQAKRVPSCIYPSRKHVLSIPGLDAQDTTLSKELMPSCRLLREICRLRENLSTQACSESKREYANKTKMLLL